MLKQDVIQSINSANLQVLEIYNPICKNETTFWFITNSFNVPDNHTSYYTVTGYDATRIINEDSLHLQGQDARNMEVTILTKIQQLPIIEKRFSRDFAWVWHTKSSNVV